MKTCLDCVPCFLSQTLDACRLASDDTRLHERVLRRVLRRASEFPFDRTPPEMGAEIHRIIREETGDPDPYAGVKARFNAFALGLLPELRQRIAAAADPFAAAVRLAIAGNVIDFALGSDLGEETVLQTIEDALVRPLDVDHLQSLRAATAAASSILYLGDNAGEIVLDRLLLERLPRGRVTFVVRGAPVINDATLADAEAAGLIGLVEVVDNGSDVPGTKLEDCSADLRERFRRADLVISKGQGNYESLSDAGREVYHLFKAKCAAIARDADCAVGDIVVLRRSPRG
jgi:uncharacterized protein with ATP-grasp and redox domains